MAVILHFVGALDVNFLPETLVNRSSEKVRVGSVQWGFPLNERLQESKIDFTKLCNE